jgi:hypothetical protein
MAGGQGNDDAAWEFRRRGSQLRSVAGAAQG